MGFDRAHFDAETRRRGGRREFTAETQRRREETPEKNVALLSPPTRPPASGAEGAEERAFPEHLRPGRAHSSAPSAREPRLRSWPEYAASPISLFSAPRRLGGEFLASSASPRLRVKKEAACS